MEKRIGILTTGGDCSGLNSVIRSAFVRASALGYRLLGIKRGFRGLASDTPDLVDLTSDICDASMLSRAGSVIYSDTKWISSSLATGVTVDDIKHAVYRRYEELHLDGLICIGGDGSLTVLHEFLSDDNRLNVVFIPKTIDNDVNHTDFAIGFQSSLQVVVGAIEDIRSSARSHERTMVVEVMGRDAGYIAMYAGLAAGADAILVPELKFSMERLVDHVKACYARGQDHCIIVVSESVETDDFRHQEEFVEGVVKYTHLEYKGIGKYIAAKIKAAGIESRCSVLGHIQRGGATCVNDRLMGTLFGIEAVNLIASGQAGKFIAFANGKVNALDIKDVVKSINRKLSADNEYVRAAKELGVYVGEV